MMTFFVVYGGIALIALAILVLDRLGQRQARKEREAGQHTP